MPLNKLFYKFFSSRIGYGLICLKRIIEYNVTKKPHHFPSMFQIQTNNLCNGSCLMCPINENKKKPEIMSDELFEKIMSEIVQESKKTRFHLFLIHLFLQNEPLTDKDIFKKIKLIKEGGKEKIFTALITNGTLFSDKFIKELKTSSLDSLEFSIDAYTEDTYKRIRPGLKFKDVISNVDKVINSGYAGKINVSFVKQKDNIHELSKFKKCWTRKGVKPYIQNIVNRGGNLKNFNEICIEKERTILFKIFFQTISNRLFSYCPNPFICFNIVSNGDVIFCCNDINKVFVMGNVKESSIKEIWNNERYKIVRNLIYTKTYSKLPVCRYCSGWNK